MKKNIIYIIFFICGITFAQNPIEMVVDTTNIRIGEQIEYKISVDKQENVIFPKLVLDSLKKVEVVQEFNIDTTETKYIKKYLNNIPQDKKGAYVSGYAILAIIQIRRGDLLQGKASIKQAKSWASRLPRRSKTKKIIHSARVCLV